MDLISSLRSPDWGHGVFYGPLVTWISKTIIWGWIRGGKTLPNDVDGNLCRACGEVASPQLLENPQQIPHLWVSVLLFSGETLPLFPVCENQGNQLGISAARACFSQCSG